MKTTGSICLLEWVLRANYDGRYSFFADIFRSIDETSWFWPRYEDLFAAMPTRKRALTHYLFTAAFQYVLGRHPYGELERHDLASPSYDNGPAGSPPTKAFLDFCKVHWDHIERTAHSHEVQINKLGRNALMLPLLLEAENRLGGPEAVFVEVGSSVGLGLLWPWLAGRYSTDSWIEGCFYEDDPACNCRIVGEPTLPLSGTGPRPARLVGIEIDTLNADSEDDVAWLRALVAPNDAFGRRELERGLSLLRLRRPEILAGCVLDRLYEIVADMSAGQPLVVYHCMTLHHLIEAGKLDSWRRLLRQFAQTRPVIEAYVAWEEEEPSATLWPVEIRIQEWHREGQGSELIGWTDPSADGTLLRFRD